LFSKVYTWANTNRPVSCTTGSGMQSDRANAQVPSLSVHGITAARGRMRESINMVISCDAQDDPVGDPIRLPPT
jgi:hypothetical protein